ncbi:biofilm development regulator YmgB/AriR family protein [Superficieibacter sp.]|uniref:biofilm development regulator YmgB/AriR family protein n=1 Tax=Superficieibacter sp. TaxID=2303322 RepID=UPI0028B01619|nr:biofilm development regulator YmgB/AriR family protein [Superficieibacter sp.]
MATPPVPWMPSGEETLGAIVIELLRNGKGVSRHSICLKLAARLEQTSDPVMEVHYGELLAILLGKGIR